MIPLLIALLPGAADATAGAAEPAEATAAATAAETPTETAAETAAETGESPAITPLPEEVQAAMTGVTWQPGCPVPLADLRLVTVPYVDETGREHRGRLVVHRDEAEAVATVFATLHAAGFVVHRVEPAYLHAGDDDLLMAENITTAFNCRRVTGGRGWSEHSFGKAIDLNPLWNPYVRGDRVLPEAGRPFIDRDPERPGTIVDGGPAVSAFAAIGWRWGGHWRSLQDYQHFSASGR